MYYTVIKHKGHLRTRGICRQHEPKTNGFYITRVFSNVRSVLFFLRLVLASCLDFSGNSLSQPFNRPFRVAFAFLRNHSYGNVCPCGFITHFHMKGFAHRPVSKQNHKRNRKMKKHVDLASFYNCCLKLRTVSLLSGPYPSCYRRSSNTAALWEIPKHEVYLMKEIFIVDLKASQTLSFFIWGRTKYLNNIVALHLNWQLFV